MAKKKSPKYRSDNRPSRDESAPQPSSQSTVALRETIESIVVAFVLAFLFRTFEAEAFVIPTGSMSPSLQGQHKDVHCSACGYRFRTTASTEGEERDALLAAGRIEEARSREVMAGMCPMCRQTMLFRTDGLPEPDKLPPHIASEDIEFEPSYPGDRILVDKYGFGFHEPQRWDVVVFKFPGNGEMNYIKRLVGLPGEELQVYQGDIFIRPLEGGSDFAIERKPPHKIATMLQPVHDTDYDPSILFQAGWPLRWSNTEAGGWDIVTDASGQTVEQTFKIAASEKADPTAPIAWLRYQHFVPYEDDWTLARAFHKEGKLPGIDRQEWINQVEPELITDFNPYNARVLRGQIGWQNTMRSELDITVPMRERGMNWVGDLALACEVEVHQPQGELHLDLVEAGVHFTCQIDLRSGKATLGIAGSEAFSATADTPVNSAGTYQLRFANVDDQLMLWVNDDLIAFDEEAGAMPYDADAVFSDRERAIPVTGDDDPGDLSPAGVGARGAALTVRRLEVLRDIYYVAVSYKREYPYEYARLDESYVTPDGERMPALRTERQLFRDPEAWPRFLSRNKEPFKIEKEQFFVMGDNSPESLDCRLWKNPNGEENRNAVPGGAYLDARLMTGEAVCVFWPHSWGSIPGVPKLPGFPNFWDMRLVK